MSKYNPLRHLTSDCLAPTQRARLTAAATARRRLDSGLGGDSSPSPPAAAAAAVVLLPPQVLLAFEARRWTHVACCILACSIVGFGFAAGIMSSSLQRVYGLDQQTITTMNAIGSIVSFLAFPAGWLQDRRGPRATVLIATTGTVIGFILYARIFAGALTTALPLLCVASGLATAFATYYDGSCMLSSLFHFSLNRGDMVVVQKTFMGLATTVLSLTYLAFFKPEDDGTNGTLGTNSSLGVHTTSLAPAGDAVVVVATLVGVLSDAASNASSVAAATGALGVGSPLARNLAGYCYVCALLAALWTLVCMLGFMEPPQMFSTRKRRFGKSFFSPVEPLDSDDDEGESPEQGEGKRPDERTGLLEGSDGRTARACHAGASRCRRGLAAYFNDEPREESTWFKAVTRIFSRSAAYRFSGRGHHAKQFDVQLVPLAPASTSDGSSSDAPPDATSAADVFRALCSLAAINAADFAARDATASSRDSKRRSHAAANNSSNGKRLAENATYYGGIDTDPSPAALAHVRRSSAITAHDFLVGHGISFIEKASAAEWASATVVNAVGDEVESDDNELTSFTPVVVADLDLIKNRADIWTALINAQPPDGRTLRVARGFLAWNMFYLFAMSIMSNYVTLTRTVGCAIAILSHLGMWLFFLLPPLQYYVFTRTDSLVAILRVPDAQKAANQQATVVVQTGDAVQDVDDQVVVTSVPSEFGDDHSAIQAGSINKGSLAVVEYDHRAAAGAPATATAAPPAGVQSKDLVFPRPLAQPFLTSIRGPDLWLFWLGLAGIFGTGPVVVQNAEQMYTALAGPTAPAKGATLVISLIGVGTAFGRAGFALLESQLLSPRRMTATLMLPLPSLIAGVAVLLLFVTPVVVLWMPFMVIAIAYGGAFAVLLLSARQIFTVDLSLHYLFLYTSGLTSVAVGLGAFGPWYDKVSQEQHAAAGKCYGTKCVVQPMLVMAAMCLAGAVFGALFHLRWVKRNGLSPLGRLH